MTICTQCGKVFKVGRRKYMVQEGWRKKLFCSYECRAEWVKQSEAANKFLDELTRRR